MQTSITLCVDSVDEIIASNHDSIEITLTGTELISQLIDELGLENLLDEIDSEAIQQYLEEKAVREVEDDDE